MAAEAGAQNMNTQTASNVASFSPDVLGFRSSSCENVHTQSMPTYTRSRRPMRSTAMLAGARQNRYCPVNQLKHIALDKNGTFMSDFDPEKSKREMRKLNRKIHKENKKQNQMYDETGRLLENSLDLCDCLDKDCPGCHFPCPKCSSEKCGAECRCERRWLYEQIEVEGTNLVMKWNATKLG